THDIDVIAKWKLMVQTAHDVQFGGAAIARLSGALDDLVTVHDIGACFTQISPECAEVAGVYAHVRGVDVRVDVVVCEIARVTLAHQVRHRTECEQVVGSLEREPILKAQALPSFDFFTDGPPWVVRTHNCSPASSQLAPALTNSRANP